ncbi:hypothetical protein BH11MYX3_BH11MYX3_34280 [soil metagenome]
MSTPTTELPNPVDRDLEAGERVGEYEVEGKLGQGAFGTVFKAVHPLIGKVVAIKVLARRFSVDPEMVSRFIAEARAVNQIRHRHIIDIFSFGGLDDGRQYYVMEYLDGEALDQLLDREKQIPIAEALSILRAIAKALDAAHAKGIAHRDLKAENVFLGRDSDGGLFPKLLDFGIAKLMSPEDGLKHKTRTCAPIGTPYYMSPEQCRGKDVDHRTDIYAFGVLVYLMLTGVYPFDADDYMSILMKQISDQPSAPSTHNALLTPEIDDAVAWFMQKDPANRPPDLRNAMKALEHAAANAGIATSPPTTSWDVQTGPTPKPFQTEPPHTTAPLLTGIPRGQHTPESQLPPAARRSRTPLFAIAALAAAAIGVVIVIATRKDAASTPEPAPTHVITTQPAPVPVPPKQPIVTAPDLTPQTLIITITGVPDGTEVFAGGMTVGAAPGPVQLPRVAEAMVLTFKADGYLPTSTKVVPDHDQALTMVMKKKKGSGPGIRRPGRDDIENPFGGK